jgi:hypothetical protein
MQHVYCWLILVTFIIRIRNKGFGKLAISWAKKRMVRAKNGVVTEEISTIKNKAST